MRVIVDMKWMRLCWLWNTWSKWGTKSTRASRRQNTWNKRHAKQNDISGRELRGAIALKVPDTWCTRTRIVWGTWAHKQVLHEVRRAREMVERESWKIRHLLEYIICQTRQNQSSTANGLANYFLELSFKIPSQKLSVNQNESLVL